VEVLALLDRHLFFRKSKCGTLLCEPLIVTGSGMTLQRKSHVREDLRPFATRRRAYRQPMWLFGFITSVTSNLFSTIFQLDTLPVAILAPLGAVGLIYNAVNSRLFLRDAFGREGYIGTVLVMTGAALVAVFGSVDEERHGLDELLVLWRKPAFLSFFLVVIAAVTILLVVVSPRYGLHYGGCDHSPTDGDASLISRLGVFGHGSTAPGMSTLSCRPSWIQ